MSLTILIPIHKSTDSFNSIDQSPYPLRHTIHLPYISRSSKHPPLITPVPSLKRRYDRVHIPIKKNFIIIPITIDDFLVAANRHEAIEKINFLISKTYQITDHRTCTKMLGRMVIRPFTTVSCLSQHLPIRSILATANIFECQPITSHC